MWIGAQENSLFNRETQKRGRQKQIGENLLAKFTLSSLLFPATSSDNSNSVSLSTLLIFFQPYPHPMVVKPF